MRLTSLTRRFLISVGLMSVGVTVAATLVTYAVFRGELERREIESMRQYVEERARREERQFADLEAVHQAATAALERRVEALPADRLDALLDLHLPLRPDGTRRTARDLWHGRVSPHGDRVHGLGGFIAGGDRLSQFEKRLFLAALTTTSRFGEAQLGAYDNFYFYTPQNRMVMFAPNRSDRLLFYRQDAPATLDFSGEQMARIILPGENPSGSTVCTDLQRRLTDDAGMRTAVACVTPVYLKGRFVGAFGSSLELDGYLRRAVAEGLPGAANMIIDRDGQLVALPEGLAAEADAAAVEQRKKTFDTVSLAILIRQAGRPAGVLKSPDGQHIVAYGVLHGPNWSFLVTRPTAAIAAAARASAAWVLLVGFLAAAVMAIATIFLARRAVITPLSRLLASAEAERTERGSGRDIADIEGRVDEIGQLARALRSERERADEILESLEERVRCRTAELETALQEKSRFLANMSHELRTPLNGVVAVSEVLGQRQQTAEDRELAEVIIASGRLLEQVLTDVLDMSKIEAGQMRLDETEVDMEAVVRQIAGLHRAAAEAKGLSLSWTLGDAARGAWRADAVRLTQILSNLLSNAVKFTEAGEVHLSVDADDDGLCFSVRDTGIGFDADTAARLFRRFEQADASITRRFGGTGLGLSISLSLAELMRGRIEAESTSGQGSVFRLYLPLERVSAPAAPGGRRGRAAPELEASTRVLLAEDHPTNQRVVKLILEMAGIAPTVVSNGREAVELLAVERFDAVLMDMQMPEMDGLSATAALRRMEVEEGRARTPVIMLTANALDEHVEASRAAGADMHVTKPVRPDVLLAAIAEVLDGEQPQAGRAREAG